MTERHDSPALDRRGFIRRSGLGAVAALTVPGALVSAADEAQAAKAAPAASRIAFNTANLVAQVSGWHYKLSGWMDQHNKTIAATDEAAWRAICKQIAAAGFKAVEVWEAHAAPESLDEAKAKAWKQALVENGLQPIGYAGGLRRQTLQVCRWLGIPRINGGLRDHQPDAATALCREFGVGFNIENHPQKSAQELLAEIGGGDDWLGVCIDMGWLGTQGVSAPDVIRACGPFVRHTHVKDVRAAGGHETVMLGEGVVNVPACLKTLRAMRYAGWYSWEDEPEDRNPLDSAVRNRKWLEEQLGQA
ncbi:MAG TPA: sugar phosphate isomerase/epimerase family protein [Vicinamibacteria bacterium]|nr:sugar phosphate isomerase/epimerase family protein [Vicinamibacteria bacterium]